MVGVLDLFLDTAGADGAPGTKTDTDPLGAPNFRFKQADNPTIDTGDPIPIPTAGTEFSRFKNMYLKVGTAPDTQIDNFKLFTDGAGFGTGITVRVGDQFPTNNLAADTGYNVSDANEILTNHTNVTSMSDLFTFTSGAPLSGPTISEAGSILDVVNEETNYFILGMEVISTAAPGNLTDETLTIQYDEI